MTKGYMTKKNIFDEAVRLFAERDYKVVTLKQIAQAVGITEAAVYRYYQNKAEILDEILEQLKQRVQKYILNKYQVDKYIETDTPRRLLERYLKILNVEEEDSVFISRAYRILNMEYLTNDKAMEVLSWWIQDSLVDSLQYALGKLIERDSIPKCDTWAYAMLWTNFIFAETVRKMTSESLYGEKSEWLDKSRLLAEHLIQMTITGKIHQEIN